MVAITVAIAATVYVYVSGMIGKSPESAPSLQFVKDASQMTLTVAQADTANIAWSDFEVVNATGVTQAITVYNAALTGYVTAGDTLTFTEIGTYKIRYTPTNTLMGEWTFA
jgi:FlaG/FlaF family flagellin (archaellin)